MNIIPAEYQDLELSRFEKIFVNYASNEDDFGYLLLKVNTAMIQNEYQNVLIYENGVIFFKFFNDFDNIDNFNMMMPIYSKTIFQDIKNITVNRLKTNKALIDESEKIKIPINFLCIFPKLQYKDINSENLDSFTQLFLNNNCMFLEDFSMLRSNFISIMDKYVYSSGLQLSDSIILITEKNVNSIVQRIAPEYTIVRSSYVTDEETFVGVDDEMLIVNDDDIAVRAYMLDSEQINIVNKIKKGDQLILACAGSGKSVILISKCFKAARMNPNKKFLITCYNKRLQSLYNWYIDRAGLKEKNVECITFHKLCKKLAESSGIHLNQGKMDDWPSIVINRFSEGLINTRYYGVFIDEVQLFEQEWYKLCFNLLENKNSNEHLFVICGDKTQKIKKQQKQGKAPWNAGEGYPNYRGGNKNIRIEKNYRNCLEVNEFINRFVANAKQLLFSLPGEADLDPDKFLRGKAFRTGVGAYIKKLDNYTSMDEAKRILECINEAHDKYEIPYDEIAVVMYNKKFGKKMRGWYESTYNLEQRLLSVLAVNRIPSRMMYQNDINYAAEYGDDGGGVALISFESILGLDFRAIIVCGLKPLGEHDKTKQLDFSKISNEEEKSNVIAEINKNISLLYVACTRARDLLYILEPEPSEDSIYIDLIEKSI